MSKAIFYETVMQNRMSILYKVLQESSQCCGWVCKFRNPKIVHKQLTGLVYKSIRYYYYTHKVPSIQKIAVIHNSTIVLLDVANIANITSTLQSNGGKLSFIDVHTIISIISYIGGCNLEGEICSVTLTITCWLWLQWMFKVRSS
jgi:hypothetical protein